MSLVVMLLGLLVFNVNATNILQGLVVGVSDGDSLTLLDAEKRQHKIRLQGIDAPEMKQAYGQKSKESLSKLVYNKTIKVHWSKKDRFGRTVGQVMLGDIDICLEQVRRGMAWHFKDYQDEQSVKDRDLYDRSEVEARELRLGLWQDAAPIEPAVFRQKK
ncbi:thermonuclease family protein [Limnohabitans sp. Rim28]|jgi:endonuclease YncB( thermonuclease family)|uniref:thermonuclease family protein n=1 Tax=Limnohabitans sp. Rim28 TaxID=1100720 RepID=UPI0003071E3C|nr:thermonuclease family protein [Limnohabitans sp. Rim28]PVE05307.1 nuclease [Limnohabitans sp. Rim28]